MRPLVRSLASPYRLEVRKSQPPDASTITPTSTIGTTASTSRRRQVKKAHSTAAAPRYPTPVRELTSGSTTVTTPSAAYRCQRAKDTSAPIRTATRTTSSAIEFGW